MKTLCVRVRTLFTKECLNDNPIAFNISCRACHLSSWINSFVTNIKQCEQQREILYRCVAAKETIDSEAVPSPATGTRDSGRARARAWARDKAGIWEMCQCTAIALPDKQNEPRSEGYFCLLIAPADAPDLLHAVYDFSILQRASSYFNLQYS